MDDAITRLGVTWDQVTREEGRTDDPQLGRPAVLPGMVRLVDRVGAKGRRLDVAR